jgi:3',5'-cyclic AMP phosphodiesterase CpdA
MSSDCTLLHLSDLHLREHQADSVLAALRAGLERCGVERPAVVVTGDLFDSSGLGRAAARDLFLAFVRTVRDAFGSGTPVPMAFVPGNHDRREMGVVRGGDQALFDAIAAVAPEGVQVLGTDRAALSKRIAIEGVPAIVVAYDSTYLPRGLLSAGGTVRTDDLLQLAAEIEDEDPDLPVLWLSHHHLIPTPVTDKGRIETEGKSWLVRAAVAALPRLVSYGDREEIFMTAYGAGTAVSLLHALGRAVVVLHGHKHYPTARLLKGTIEGDGDVLFASAGSAGLSEAWKPELQPKLMHLWPSFNIARLGPDRLDIETVAFSARDPAKPVFRRPLVSVARAGRRFDPVAVPAPGTSEILLALNCAVHRVIPSVTAGEFDLESERRIELVAPMGKPVVELVEGIAGGEFEASGVRRPLPWSLELGEGATRFRVRRAGCLSLERASAVYGRGNAFEWVGLQNRYGCRRVELEVHGLPHGGATAFGSLTDLNTGREVPARLERGEGKVALRLDDCPARRLLRVYWPLER